MQGEELNYGLGRSGVLPELVISMIKIGEETGQLSFMLEKLAVFYKREVDSAVSSLTKAMEPTVVFVVSRYRRHDCDRSLLTDVQHDYQHAAKNQSLKRNSPRGD